ncbi:ABC transporter substrate-binding protein [Nocardioides cavernaquae]|uniref:Sugar ABC transporter substrate-binding protein n=1 Tax=Nocardioides cavernaquae TaxID=2321396 RepID=A0A3A5HF30_9ACTN|nr:sugar ABC transporter substrate-binding protein [Nocardioides cavernaquae]RJS46590.1 sugar ABC transporter substrate-binding protein [Nocardioides cavernaquae]
MRRNSPFRRSAVAGLAVLTTSALLAACGGSGSDGESASDTVTVWTGLPYDTFQKPNAEIFAACEKETGIKAKLADFPAGELTSKALKAATSGDLPGLLYLEGTDLGRVVETGLLTALTDYGITGDDYSETVQDMGSIDGELYGIAPGVNTVAAFYNKDLFAAKGVKVPRTYAEFRAAAKKVSDDKTIGFSLAADTGTGPYVFLPFLLGAGGDPADLATPEAATALQLWNDLVADGSAPKSATTVGWEAQDAFREGKAAMVLAGAWLFGEDLPFEVGAFPVPTPDGTGNPISPIGAELWTIPATGEKTQKNAAKLLACVTSDENSLAMAEASHRTPSKTTISADYLAKFPAEQPLVDLIDDAYLRDPETAGAEAEALATAIQDSLANGTAPADALAAASK